MPYEAIVLGVSTGGLRALKTLLPALPASFPLPIAIVQHIGERSDNFLCDYLDRASKITVKEIEDKETLAPGTAYLAPPGYHALIEPDRSFALSVDPPVNYSCPSIDVLFESAANVFRESLIGIVLTGANSDGAQGLKTISALGGLSIVEDPRTAEASFMPSAAIDATHVDHIVDLEHIAPLLMHICAFPKEGENDPISANR
jgi:two-component system chemotaxis response regulator CheB